MKINLEKITETFIKELCKEPNIKEAFIREGVIEDERLEYNRWIKDRDDKKWLMYFDEINNKRYGFNSHGEWCEIFGYNNPNYDKNNTYATLQEVETALIDEAKKRRYANGITCLFGYVRQERTLQSDVLEFDINLNIITCGGNIIFKNGKWAEIVTEPLTIEPLTIEQRLEKLERKMNL